MKKLSKTAILIILLVLNICATLVLGIQVCNLSSKQNADCETIRYVMYVGLNDKDTYEQLVPTEEAKAIIDSICFKYLDGYTIQDAVGAWTDETDNPTREQTVICYFYGTDESTVHSIAEEVLVSLNQNTVLIEKAQISTEFYPTPAA